uniref:hypothetical protein n=1 Tax=Paractinoplanes polyasparticus TaxID=2856853 RepID=UPI001C85480D|nr:hypothetical protein [Actinoplanes polyasparticus]
MTTLRRLRGGLLRRPQGMSRCDPAEGTLRTSSAFGVAASRFLRRVGRLAATPLVPLRLLQEETLLLFPRQLAPAYYDEIVAACQQAGFSPDVRAFDEPPVSAWLARLSSGREVGLAPSAFAEHAARAGTEIVRRDVTGPSIMAKLSLTWASNDPSPAMACVLASARQCVPCSRSPRWPPHDGRTHRYQLSGLLVCAVYGRRPGVWGERAAGVPLLERTHHKAGYEF